MKQLYMTIKLLQMKLCFCHGHLSCIPLPCARRSSRCQRTFASLPCFHITDMASKKYTRPDNSFENNVLMSFNSFVHLDSY